MTEAKNKALTVSPSTTNKDGFVFKWEGSFEELESFVETTLSLTGSWSPVRDGQKFTTNPKSITITFYNNRTLQIQGKKEDREKLIEDLRKLATPRNPREPANDECSGVVQSVDTRLVVNDSTTAKNTACAEGSS
jgi:hypothetical protein